MTKVGSLFEEEKQGYAAEQAEKIAANLLKQGLGVENVATVCELSLEKVKEIFERLLAKA